MALLPPGRVTIATVDNSHFLTNVVAADLHSIDTAVETPFSEHLEGWFDVGEVIDTLKMARMGFYNANYRVRIVDGKFVFFNNDAFVIAHRNLTHHDFHMFVGVDNAAAIGAGFIMINPEGVELYGYSESLNKLTPRLDHYDRDLINAHLHLGTH